MVARSPAVLVRVVGCSGRDFGVSSSPYGQLQVGNRGACGARRDLTGRQSCPPSSGRHPEIPREGRTATRPDEKRGSPPFFLRPSTLGFSASCRSQNDVRVGVGVGGESDRSSSWARAPYWDGHEALKPRVPAPIEEGESRSPPPAARLIRLPRDFGVSPGAWRAALQTCGDGARQRSRCTDPQPHGR